MCEYVRCVRTPMTDSEWLPLCCHSLLCETCVALCLRGFLTNKLATTTLVSSSLRMFVFWLLCSANALSCLQILDRTPAGKTSNYLLVSAGPGPGAELKKLGWVAVTKRGEQEQTAKAGHVMSNRWVSLSLYSVSGDESCKSHYHESIDVPDEKITILSARE